MSINKTNIRRVIDQIKAEPKRFNMSVYVGTLNSDPEDDIYPHVEDEGHDTTVLAKSCGTVACIAGWAAYLAQPGRPPASTSHMMEIASEFLGLPEPRVAALGDDYNDTDRLFFGWLPDRLDRPNGLSLDAIAPEMAVKVLEHLIDTGEVDWSIVQE